MTQPYDRIRFLAGTAGFEPADAGVKAPCLSLLTTFLYISWEATTSKPPARRGLCELRASACSVNPVSRFGTFSCTQ